MKRFLSLVLCFGLLLCLSACGKKTGEYKLGIGVIAQIDGEEKEGMVLGTVAAVITDKNGKIVACRLDAIENKIGIENGIIDKTDLAAEFKTKQELSEDYGMKEASPIKKEWYEQANHFSKYVIGLNSEQVAAIISENGTVSGTILSGCTIDISDFIKAIVLAIKNSESKSFKASEINLGLGIISEPVAEKSHNFDGSEGVIGMEITISATNINSKGAVDAVYTDALDAEVKFNSKGEVTNKSTIKTKKDLGDKYGMKEASPIKKEWYEQARAYEDYCVGLDATGVNSIMLTADKKAESNALRAGCTIAINNFILATKKAATAAK